VCLVVSLKNIQFCNSGSLVKVFLFVGLGTVLFIQVSGDESCVWLGFVIVCNGYSE
jgi:hypothetical protein